MLGHLMSACRELFFFFIVFFQEPAHNNLTLASKGPGDIILKRLNTDSEQAEHGGNTTFGKRQQTMAFGGREENVNAFRPELKREREREWLFTGSLSCIAGNKKEPTT